MPIRLYHLFATIINAALSVISFFIILRVILRLFSANSATPVVSWVFSISEFFIYPFRGIFPNLGLTSGVLDIVALIALLGYALLGYLLIGVLRSLVRGTTDIVDGDAYSTHYHDIDEPRSDHHH